MKKIQKMKKDIDLKHRNSANPTRKEREEIEFLKKELTQLKEEQKSKDSKNKMTMDRVKKQVK